MTANPAESVPVATQVLKNPLDDRRVLEAGDHLQPPAAAPAEIDLDREYPFGDLSG
jgi:hypothetical protein